MWRNRIASGTARCCCCCRLAIRMVRIDALSRDKPASLMTFLSAVQRLSAQEKPRTVPVDTTYSVIGERPSLASLSDFLSAFRKLSREKRAAIDLRSDEQNSRLDHFLKEFCRLKAFISLPSSPPPEIGLESTRVQQFLSEFGRVAKKAGQFGDQINIWSVAGLGRNEVRNASVLAWALDSREPHGRGSAIFYSLLERLSRQHNGPFPLDLTPTSAYRILTEHYSLDNDGNRVDLVIDGPDFAAFIEVKINAREGREQIQRYERLLEERAKALRRNRYGLIYLTRSGDKPQGPTSPVVVTATWNDISYAIQKVVRNQQSEGITFVDQLLLQFARHIERL